MTNMDRRKFVSTIGAMAACTAAASPVSGADAGAPLKTRFSDEKNLDWGWCIARARSAVTSGSNRQNIVDFWSKSISAISIADYLPSEISRGVLWFDGFSQDETFSERLKYIDTIYAKYGYEWIEEPRSVAACSNYIELLTLTLRSLIVDNRSACGLSRTALLDLTSASPFPNEPEWAQIIPALAPCYDRIIGYCHLEQRGLRHFKHFLDHAIPEQNSSVHTAASQCDAVIFTSGSLIENDINLPAFASTGTLVGHLMQRLGHALLDDYVLEQIIPTREKGLREKPRAFALGSITSTVGHPNVDLRDLCRQRELVIGSFGDLLRRPIQPLLIATLADERSSNIMRDQVLRIPLSFIKLANSDRLCGGDSLEPVHLITLWPFEAEFGQPGIARHPIVQADQIVRPILTHPLGTYGA